jgi:hypothetical protein
LIFALENSSEKQHSCGDTLLNQEQKTVNFTGRDLFFIIAKCPEATILSQSL